MGGFLVCTPAAVVMVPVKIVVVVAVAACIETPLGQAALVRGQAKPLTCPVVVLNDLQL